MDSILAAAGAEQGDQCLLFASNYLLLPSAKRSYANQVPRHHAMASLLYEFTALG